MIPENVKIVIFVPESHADIVREAMGKAGAGKIGNYSFCSFSSKGVGRFRPERKWCKSAYWRGRQIRGSC